MIILSISKLPRLFSFLGLREVYLKKRMMLDLEAIAPGKSSPHSLSERPRSFCSEYSETGSGESSNMRK
jgi:hypothetical protein